MSVSRNSAADCASPPLDRNAPRSCASSSASPAERTPRSPDEISTRVTCTVIACNEADRIARAILCAAVTKLATGAARFATAAE